MVSAILGVGGGLGLVLSGALVDYASWRWLFIVGAIVRRRRGDRRLALRPRVADQDAVEARPARRACCSRALLVTLLLALTEGPSWGWGSARSARALRRRASLLARSGCAPSCASPEPMVDMRMMAQRTVLFTNLTAIFTGFAMFGAFVLLPSLMQTAPRRRRPLRLRAVADGDRALPAARRRCSGSSPGPIAGRLGARYGSRMPLILGHGARRASGSRSSPSFHAHPLEISLGMVFIGDRRPVRVRRDGEADRRRGAAVGDGRRDRHEHGHADGRRGDRRAGRRGDRQRGHDRRQRTSLPSRRSSRRSG